MFHLYHLHQRRATLISRLHSPRPPASPPGSTRSHQTPELCVGTTQQTARGPAGTGAAHAGCVCVPAAATTRQRSSPRCQTAPPRGRERGEHPTQQRAGSTGCGSVSSRGTHLSRVVMRRGGASSERQLTPDMPEADNNGTEPIGVKTSPIPWFLRDIFFPCDLWSSYIFHNFIMELSRGKHRTSHAV